MAECPIWTEGIDWLAGYAHENLGTEVALRCAAPGGAVDVALAHRDGALAGVSVSSTGGQWFLEATRPDVARELVASVLTTGVRGRPSKVTASGGVKAWLRPVLEEAGIIRREHDLLAMLCREAPKGRDGRWATSADRAALERYQVAYNEERRTSITPDWDELLGRPAVAVLEDGGRIVAVVKRTADTMRYATIGGTWTEPALRGRGLAARLTGFIVDALLNHRPAVHLVVDDDNEPAIALYRSLGFEEVGRCYMAYLSPGAA
jgi:ribosomal protein S18 acetylase RimI-like enzyme